MTWPLETVELSESFGRVLGEPVVTDRDQPPFDRVAMDGIAIDYSRYTAGQRWFAIAHLQAAGAPPLPLGEPDKCVEIMTGAALPPGVTTVVRYEDLTREGEGFRLPEGVEDGKSIHRRGKDVAAGSVLAQAGRLIGPAEIGMLATCGYAEVKVVRRPRVAVVATGNELVAVSKTPLDHQIRMSNVFQLAQLLKRYGASPQIYHLPDDRATLLLRLAAILNEIDLVVLSGGVSKGKLDFVPEVLSELGVEKAFHGVAQRPGKPMWCGRRKETMVFGLPGNPVSSLNCLITYVLPFLQRQLGLEEQAIYCRLADEVRFTPDLTLFQLVGLRSDKSTGVLEAYPISNQGSGDGTSLLRADGFLELPRGKSAYSPGEVHRVRRL